MRAISTMTSAVALVLATAATGAQGFEGRRAFMPPNELSGEATPLGGITRDRFDAVLDKAERLFASIIERYGARLTIHRFWSDSQVNAYADQPSASRWELYMYGGLARRPEVTEDGFAMVVCHELGHHLAGYPFRGDWAANEGQSDYFATSACAIRLFGANAELAERAKDELPATMRAKCNAAHPAAQRSNCYRAMLAGKSLADLLGTMGGQTVNFDTPDPSVVYQTDDDHPQAQCRLDTYVAGALCGPSRWDFRVIPGKEQSDRGSYAAQTEAYEHSCARGAGARPRCWFAPLAGVD